MKTKIYFIFLFVLLISISVSGQKNCSASKLASQIDSISKAQNLDLGQVKYHRIVSSGANSSTTQSTPITQKGKFKVEGCLLIIGNSYYNLNKLLYFRIMEETDKKNKEKANVKYFVFFFQAY